MQLAETLRISPSFPVVRVGLALVGLLQACQPAAATTRPPQAPPSTALPTAAGGPGGCAGSQVSLLLLQADATQRSAIEHAMMYDLAVVAFDCKTLAVVESCRIDGRYEYVAGRREEIHRRISTPEQAAAPLWGASSPPLALETGETLELRLISVGQRRASRAGATFQDLQGACAGATHFIRSARLGADLLSGTHGSTSHESAAGELSTCPSSGASTENPSHQCRAVLQVELVPVQR